MGVIYPWHVVLHLITHTTLGMAWWLYMTSFQIWSHSLGDMWLGWKASHCIDYVPSLSYIVHAPTRHMEWVTIHRWHVVSGDNTHHHDDGMVVLQFTPNLVLQLGWSVPWMGGILFYWPFDRVVRHCPCIHKTYGMGDKTYGMGDNPSMTNCTLHHTPHLHGDSWCKIFSHSFGGLWPGWRVFICMCYIKGLWEFSHTPTSHVEWVTTHQWPLVPCITYPPPCG